MSGGDCYRVAGSLALDDARLTLCHGRPVYRGTETPDPDGRFGHAWCETADGDVIDRSNGLNITLPVELYYAIGRIEAADVVRFTYNEVREHVLTEHHWGPWPLSKVEGLIDA